MSKRCKIVSISAVSFVIRGSGVKEPEFEVDQKAIPRVITDVQENGTALQVDNQRKRYVKTEEFDEDKPNGYGRFKVFLLRRKLKKR